MSAARTDGQWIELGREVLQIEAEGLNAVKDSLDENFVTALKTLASCKGRVVVTGLGKSGLVGRKISATLSSIGTPAFFLHPTEGAHGDLGMIRPGDVVLAVSNSGETEELMGIVPEMKGLGAKIIALTGISDSSLGQLSDVVVNTAVPREACPMGLAPTASTTAALAVGDALAVCLIHWNSFKEGDFKRYHPGGSLGRRLALDIGSLMHTESLPVVDLKSSLGQALDALNKGGLGTVAVVEDTGRLAGIVTDGDVRRMVCRGEFDLDGPVAQYMTGKPKSGRPDQSAGEILDLMEASAITVLPIVDGERRLMGMVHMHDLLGKGRLKFATYSRR